MSNRALKRNKSNHINAACLLAAMLLAGLLGPSTKQELSAQSQALATITPAESTAAVASPATFPTTYSAKRDPWANPIISCSLVSPRDFGYDQAKIYRLPQQPKVDRVEAKSCMRDPMSNLLLRNSEGSAS